MFRVSLVGSVVFAGHWRRSRHGVVFKGCGQEAASHLRQISAIRRRRRSQLHQHPIHEDDRNGKR